MRLPRLLALSVLSCAVMDCRAQSDQLSSHLQADCAAVPQLCSELEQVAHLQALLQKRSHAQTQAIQRVQAQATQTAEMSQEVAERTRQASAAAEVAKAPSIHHDEAQAELQVNSAHSELTDFDNDRMLELINQATRFLSVELPNAYRRLGSATEVVESRPGKSVENLRQFKYAGLLKSNLPSIELPSYIDGAQSGTDETGFELPVVRKVGSRVTRSQWH
jgi:hypothetical protein